ncbi:hypothetical protein ACRAWB_04440 [Leifsonia poae]|uniref:hypothetical protein n=1 Tax=Leifsonia poae TaxID=110933 RepID=UPI003D687550
MTRLLIPDALGTPEAAAFEELNGVLNGIVVDLWGDEDFVETAEQALAAYREHEYTERIVFVAVEEGAIVGRVEAIFPSTRTRRPCRCWWTWYRRSADAGSVRRCSRRARSWRRTADAA